MEVVSWKRRNNIGNPSDFFLQGLGFGDRSATALAEAGRSSCWRMRLGAVQLDLSESSRKVIF